MTLRPSRAFWRVFAWRILFSLFIVLMLLWIVLAGEATTPHNGVMDTISYPLVIRSPILSQTGRICKWLFPKSDSIIAPRLTTR